MRGVKRIAARLRDENKGPNPARRGSLFKSGRSRCLIDREFEFAIAWNFPTPRYDYSSETFPQLLDYLRTNIARIYISCNATSTYPSISTYFCLPISPPPPLSLSRTKIVRRSRIMHTEHATAFEIAATISQNPAFPRQEEGLSCIHRVQQFVIQPRCTGKTRQIRSNFFFDDILVKVFIRENKCFSRVRNVSIPQICDKFVVKLLSRKYSLSKITTTSKKKSELNNRVSQQ